MKKRLFALFNLVIAASLFVSACGFQKKPVQEGDKTSVKQELFVNIHSEPFSLHPGLANDSVSSSVLLQTFEGLTRISSEGKPESAMAEEIQVSQDSMKYTFKIRKDAKWSNGDPVTAKDFEYAWKWALDPANQSQYAYQLYYIKNGQAVNEGKASPDQAGVTAKDDKTLEVILENPTPYFLELTAFFTYFPVNSKIAEGNEKWHSDAGENYVSNGPFKMVTWDHNNKIVLEKNENYWDEKNVKLQKIEMAMVDDSNTELAMFENGELHWAGAPTGQLPLAAIPQLKESKKLKVQPIAGTYWYKLNTEQKPLDNANIRKALAYAIDRQGITENIVQDGSIPAMSVVPPTMFEENKKGHFKDNDVEAAKQFLQKGLQEMGLKDVSQLPQIKLSYNTEGKHAEIAQAVQDMWRKNLGINVELENMEWKVYMEKIQSEDYQIGRMGWTGDFNDPINFLELYRDKEGGNNNTNWENEKYKQLLIESAKEQNPDARRSLLKQAEEILMEEMPVIPVYFYTNAWVQSENLKGVVLSGLGDVQFKWAYFE